MSKITFFILLSLLSLRLYSADISSRVHKYNWDGLEVIWVEDERFPTYDVSIYFADGALSDVNKGESEAALSLLTLGTTRYSQKDLVDHLEFFGVSSGPYVTHEYSLYNVSGLVKDSIPTFKRICHMFADASYPTKELAREIKRARDATANLVADKSSLASMAFRELSLAGSPFAYPVTAKLKDLSKLNNPILLKKKLEYFNSEVFKRVYITGPKEILNIKEILNQECGWTGKTATFKRDVKYEDKNNQTGPDIILVTVPGSNQAQVRIGKIMTEAEIQPLEAIELLSTYLGGGFTSLLMRELRTSRGLVYGAGAFAAGQRRYGRGVIQTSTKTESVKELLTVVKDLLVELKNGGVRENIFEVSKGRLEGSYPFRFEKSSSFLQHLIYLDHINVDYSRFMNFQDRLKDVSSAEMAKWGGEIFDWDKLTVVVLGDKSLVKELSTFGKVKVMNYKEFL